MRDEGPASPLGGRNRKGAGAPTGNRNASCRAYRSHIHLKKRLLAERLQLLVLAAAVSHLERRLAPQNPARDLQRHHKKSHNNSLAEASAMRRGRTPNKPHPAPG